MDKIEYTEANNNFRHFVSLERDYLQLFVNSITLITAAYWLVSSIDILRYLITIVAIFLSAGVLITEIRYSQYFKHFFKVAEDIEKENAGRQFSSITENFHKPALGIRSTNVIITFYCVLFFRWLVIFILDVSGSSWFESVLRQISIEKNA